MEIKELMTKATWSTYYGNYHSLVKYISDFYLMVKLLVKDKVFKLKAGYGVKETEFIDFYMCGVGKIGLKSPLKKYLR